MNGDGMRAGFGRPLCTVEWYECYCTCARRMARSVTRQYDLALKCVGLGAVQFSTLCAVGRAGGEGATIARLADLLGVDSSTLSRNVAVLVRRELLRKVQAADARSRHLVLTQRGSETIRAGYPHWRRAQAALTEGMGVSRARLWRASLRAVSGFLVPEPRGQRERMARKEMK